MSPQPVQPPSHLDTVLTALGRASTPAVPENPHGLTRAALLGLPESQAAARAVVVGSPALLGDVAQAAPAVAGIPGALVDQVELPLVRALVLDWDAFAAGPWLGVDTHAAPALLEELVDAADAVRRRGGSVFGLPRRPLHGSGDALLLAACTVDMTNVPAVDMEERAVQTPLWTALAAEAAGRPGPTTQEGL